MVCKSANLLVFQFFFCFFFYLKEQFIIKNKDILYWTVFLIV